MDFTSYRFVDESSKRVCDYNVFVLCPLKRDTRKDHCELIVQHYSSLHGHPEDVRPPRLYSCLYTNLATIRVGVHRYHMRSTRWVGDLLPTLASNLRSLALQEVEVSNSRVMYF